MRKNLFILTAVVSAVIFCGCSKDNSNDSGGQLSITTNVKPSTDGSFTKSPISSFSSSTIGVFVSGAAYSPTANSTAAVSSGSNTVSPTPSIYINADATVYGYYPATASELTNPTSVSTKAVSVVTADDFSATSQNDYLWATPVAVSKTNRTAALTFNHALSKVIFSLKLGSTYAGAGALTEIKLTAGGDTYKFKAGTNGTMAIATGALAGLTSQSTLDYTGTKTLSTTASEIVALVAPTQLAEGTSSSSTITLAITLDGQTYSATLPVSQVAAWVAATSYTYNITVSSGELVIGTVSIADWTAGTSTDVTLS